MKRIFTILCLALLPFLTVNVMAQDTIAAWTFPSTSADSLIDAGISINSSRYISCQYGLNNSAPTYYAIPIDYTTNGSQGSPDKCAKTVGWDNAVDSIYWMVKFKTTGYGNITLYSKQQAGGSNPGPRDFQVQWKLSGGTWADLTGGTLTCANDWTSAEVNGLSLPSACDNQSSNVSLKWVITSNFDINGNALDTTGISKIDDIIILGTPITGIEVSETGDFISIYPNPSNGNFFIDNNGDINKVTVYNLMGKCVYNNENIAEQKIEISDFNPGMYIVQIMLNNNNLYNYKIVVE